MRGHCASHATSVKVELPERFRCSSLFKTASFELETRPHADVIDREHRSYSQEECKARLVKV